MAILDSSEQIFKKFAAQPLPKTEADLTSAAAAEPQNPIPLLALAVVAGFAQAERIADTQSNLAKAATRLKSAENDPEMAFASALHSALSAQLSLIEFQAPNGLKISTDTSAHEKAQAAITQLKAAAAKVPQSGLAQTITAALMTFSCNGTYVKQNYAEGAGQLSSLSSHGSQPDLAAYFLIYAHRRGGNYAQAISVGQNLEKRQPNSALVKKTIGGSYFYAGDLANAENYYRQALALSKDDPTVNFGLANILLKKGDTAEAGQQLAATKQFDTTGSLAPRIAALDAQIKT